MEDYDLFLREEEYQKFPVPEYVQGQVRKILAQLPTGRGFIIGGWARNLLSLVVGGGFVEEISSDIDLLVVGEEIPEGIEDDIQSSQSLEEYFSSRDFTANQVAVSETEIIATCAAVRDHAEGVLRVVDYPENFWGDDTSPRITFRAVRFAAHFRCRIATQLPSWELRFDGVLQGWKALQKSPEEFDRYLRIVGVTVESFIWEARTVALRDEADLLDAIYEAYPYLG